MTTLTYTPTDYTDFGTVGLTGGASGFGSNLQIGDHSCLVDNGDKLPDGSGGAFYLKASHPTVTADIEIIKCTARTGNVLTAITRGEGIPATTETNWIPGATLELVLDTASLKNMDTTLQDLVAQVNTNTDTIEGEIGNSYKREYSPLTYGAEMDGIRDPNGAMTASSAALSSTSSPGPFSAGMVGKKVLVRGAGAGGVDLFTTIASYTNSTHVTLSASASTTVSGADVFILTTDDWTALADAMYAATATGGVLKLPAGVMYVTIPQDAVGAQVTNKPVLVQGAGRGSTFIIADGSSTLSGTTILFTAAAGKTLTLADFTTIGPVDPGSQACNMVRHFGTSGRLSLRRVVAHGFAQPVQIDDGTTCRLVIEDDCEFSNPGVGLSTAVVSIQSIAQARIRGMRVTAWGISASNQNHAIYVKQSVDLDVSGCSFSGNRGIGWAIHNFGGSGTSPNVSIQDNYFASDSYQGILTNASVRSRIQNNRFLGAQRAITLQFDADIIGNQFDGISSSNHYISQLGGSSVADVNIKQNTFKTPAPPGTYAIEIDIGSSVYRIIGNTFLNCNKQYAFRDSSGTGTIKYTSNDYADTSDIVTPLTLDVVGHLLITDSHQPTLAQGSGGTNVSGLALRSGSCDTVGEIDFAVVTSTITAGQQIIQVTFANAFANAPFVILTIESSQGTSSYLAMSVSTTGFYIYNAGSLPVGASYKVAYLVIGH